MVNAVRCVAIFSITLWLIACTTAPADRTLSEKQYISHVLSKIEIIGESRHPRLVTRIQQACSIVVALHITHGGTLLDVDLIQSNCKHDINKAMLELINYSAPYPPMPDEITKDSLVIQKRWSFMPVQ